jgi:nitrite reductase/ring-hydroxylating ferredoxin subunit
VSNKCPHLGLPIQGKVVGKEAVDGCVECPFHGNKYDIKTGKLSSEWAPGVHFVGIYTVAYTYTSAQEAGTCEVLTVWQPDAASC